MTYAITDDNRLLVEGDCWEKGMSYWEEIRSQVDVSDVLEDGCATLVRYKSGSTKFITYYGKWDYLEQIDLFKGIYNYAFMEGGISSIIYEDYFHNYEYKTIKD